jgi:hypothetical protein
LVDVKTDDDKKRPPRLIEEMGRPGVVGTDFADVTRTPERRTKRLLLPRLG